MKTCIQIQQGEICKYNTIDCCDFEPVPTFEFTAVQIKAINSFYDHFPEILKGNITFVCARTANAA